MITEIQKEKESQKEKAKTKEKEKVKHTRQMAVDHSRQPKQVKRQKLQRAHNHNSGMTRIGPKTGGGTKDMPPQINSGAKTRAGPTAMTGWPSHTLNAFYPGLNPGTPSTFAKILST